MAQVLRIATPISALAGGLAVLLLGLAYGARAATPPPAKPPGDIPLASFSPKFAESAERQLVAARKKYQADTNVVTAAWELGKACFWRGEFAASDEERARLANEGIAVCRPLVISAPALPEGHYYLAMNLGQLARTKWLDALGIVKELERNLELADGMAPRLDYAGPARCLGQLYRDAPGWPISVGNRTKARKHLLRALELSPEFPENRLNLIETWIEWKEKKLLQPELDALAELLPKARKQFTGEEWAAYWDDWDRRWKEVQAQSAELLRKK
ncbi:MAG: hypothetical protein EBS05_00850 [Proteobacteria bacterium]|nr:hypothetical protein [Pseudomonadota bacterium]